MIRNCHLNKRGINSIFSHIITRNDRKKKGAIDYSGFKQIISNTYSQVF